MPSKVLVLNQDFRALTVTSLERAFVLVFLRKAETVNEVQGKVLRTVDSEYPWPSIIRLARYIHVPYKSVELTRNNIFKRDGHKCNYCGSKDNLTLDHVIPKSKGGKSTWTNLTTACKKCNSRKGHQTLEEVNMFFRIYPHKPTFINFLKKSFSGSQDDWLEYLK